MGNKRNNELVDLVKKEVLDNINVSVETKNVVEVLLNAYKGATYENHLDRHEWYRDIVSSMVNDFSFEDDKLAEKMANEHPTLQQSFFRMVVKFIKKMADKTNADARNNASVNLCKKFNEVIMNEGAYLPFI